MPNPRSRKPALAPVPAILPSITVEPESGSEEGADLGPHTRKTRTRMPAKPGRPGPGPGLAERLFRNQGELRTNARNILNLIQAERPKNTDIAYVPKQEEFRQFCRRKEYHDGETVTEDKLLLFLVEDVTSRPLRIRSRTAASSTPHTESRLAWRSVRSYVTAITDLYRTQGVMAMNSNPSPREDSARNYIRSLQRRDTARQKANYADKGRDTLLDGYTETELRKIVAELWGHMAESPECHLRTLVDFLLGHYMLTRGGGPAVDRDLGPLYLRISWRGPYTLYAVDPDDACRQTEPA